MRVVMIGPVPDPFTGQSIAFKKLKDELSLEPGVELFHVDTSPKSKAKHITGKFGVDRLIETLNILAVYFYYLFFKRPDVIYLTKGSTKLGFLRDFIIVLLKVIFRIDSRIILHLKGGNYDSFYYSSSSLLKYLIKFFLERADTIIVLGESLIKMYDFCPAVLKKIVVIENALNIDNKLKFVKKEKEVTFLFLSNLIVSKGYLDVAEAAQCLNQAGRISFKLVFAGEFMFSPDDPEDVLLKRDAFLDIINNNSNFYYLGSVSGKAKSDLLSSADVLVLPTKYHVEGQPNCIIEAMAYSCAIISTNYRSIPDLIDNTNSFFVEYASVDQLSEKMLYLINNPVGLSRMQKNSSNIYINRFRWETHYSKILKVFLGASL